MHSGSLGPGSRAESITCPYWAAGESSGSAIACPMRKLFLHFPPLSALRQSELWSFCIRNKMWLEQQWADFLHTPLCHLLGDFRGNKVSSCLAPLDRASTSSLGQPRLSCKAAGNFSHPLSSSAPPSHPGNRRMSRKQRVSGQSLSSSQWVQAVRGPLRKQYRTFWMVLLMALYKAFIRLC